jgi:hypothetical protein
MTSDQDEIIEDFLGDSPRAAQWRLLRESLLDRLNAFLKQRDDTTDAEALAGLHKQIATIRKQVAALEVEEVATQFVEDSIKVILAKPRAEEEDEEGR